MAKRDEFPRIFDRSRREVRRKPKPKRAQNREVSTEGGSDLKPAAMPGCDASSRAGL